MRKRKLLPSSSTVARFLADHRIGRSTRATNEDAIEKKKKHTRHPLQRIRTPRRMDFLLDQVHYVTAIFAKHYFREDPIEEFEVRDLGDILREDEPKISEVSDTGWKVTVGETDDARAARVHWRSAPVRGRPVLIYHPGAASIPHDDVLNRILPPGTMNSWNIGAIEAAAHGSLREFFDDALDSLHHAQLLFASSVHAFESVSRWAVENGAPYVAYCGTSLGGIATSLHMIYYGSANIYLPMLAGLDAHHLFFGGSNRSLADRARIRGKLECYKRALNFSPLLEQIPPRPPCFPLLGKHDLLMDYRRARRAWKDYPITTIERGHASGVMTYHSFTEHLHTHLPTF